MTTKRENEESTRKPRDRSRRTFMGFGIAAISYFFGATSDGDLKADLTKIGNAAYLKLGKPLEKLNNALGLGALSNWGLIRNTFGPFGPSVLCPGTHHPTFAWYQEPDWRPAGDLASLLKEVVGNQEVLTRRDEDAVIQEFSDWNKITFGGPMSNLLTARLLGYSGKEYELHRDHQVTLRWEYTNNHKTLHTREPSCEYVAGKLLTEPNWEIYDCASKLHHLPRTRQEKGKRFLDSDFLLITKLFDRTGHMNLCVGGAHGVATQQFGNILTNSDVLKDLQSYIVGAGSGPFQALFEVFGIVHDHEECHTEATKINLIDFQPLLPRGKQVRKPV